MPENVTRSRTYNVTLFMIGGLA